MLGGESPCVILWSRSIKFSIYSNSDVLYQKKDTVESTVLFFS